MVGCHIHGGSIAIAGKPARQAFAGVPVGFVDGIAFRLDLHFSVRGRRLVRSSRAAARHVAVFVNRDLYIRVVSCPGTQGNRDGPAFHCDRDHTWRLSLAAALGIYLCDVRSEEHTSELQSQSNLVCRLLLEKKKKQQSLLTTLRTLTTASISKNTNSLVTYSTFKNRFQT